MATAAHMPSSLQFKDRQASHFGAALSDGPSAALDTTLLEASMAGKSSSGRISGQGNLVPERPTWRITGRRMAAAQHRLFFLMSLDLVMLVLFAGAVLPPHKRQGS